MKKMDEMKTRCRSNERIYTSRVGLKGLFVVAMIVLVLASCSKDEDEIISPNGAAPAWARNIELEMLAVIEKLESYGTPPLETLPVSQARQAPSPADAVKELLQQNAIPMPARNIDTAGRDIPVQGGLVHLRIYTPPTGRDSYPVIVYYHGGGWVIANLDTYDASARALADQADAIVVSVAYRQAPEYKFPTAHNGSYASYQ